MAAQGGTIGHNNCICKVVLGRQYYETLILNFVNIASEVQTVFFSYIPSCTYFFFVYLIEGPQWTVLFLYILLQTYFPSAYIEHPELTVLFSYIHSCKHHLSVYKSLFSLYIHSSK